MVLESRVRGILEGSDALRPMLQFDPIAFRERRAGDRHNGVRSRKQPRNQTVQRTRFGRRCCCDNDPVLQQWSTINDIGQYKFRSAVCRWVSTSSSNPTAARGAGAPGRLLPGQPDASQFRGSSSVPS